MSSSFHRQYTFTAVICTSLSVACAWAQAPVRHGAPSASQSGIAAVVDGHNITAGEVEKLAMRMYGADVLDGIINNYLIEREAARLRVEVSEAEIDNQVQALAEAIKPKTLEEGLKEHHQTLAELREEFRHRLLALKLAARSAGTGHFVHAHVILLRGASGESTASSDASVASQASAIRKQFLAGTKFEELAKQYSQDPIGRERGGDVGVVFEGCPLDPGVVQAALQLNAGAMSDEPIKTATGYYLVMVSSTESQHPADEDNLYASAKEHYELHEGGRMLPAYLRELRAKAMVTQLLKP